MDCWESQWVFVTLAYKFIPVLTLYSHWSIHIIPYDALWLVDACHTTVTINLRNFCKCVSREVWNDFLSNHVHANNLVMKDSFNLVVEELGLIPHSMTMASLLCPGQDRDYIKNWHLSIVQLGVSSQSINMSFCQECGQNFQWTKSFRRHMNTIHNALCFKCIACTKTFKRMDSFVRHRKLMHKSHEKFGVVVCCEQNNLQSMQVRTKQWPWNHTNSEEKRVVPLKNVWFPWKMCGSLKKCVVPLKNVWFP